ncbi:SUPERCENTIPEDE1 [Hibiscus trionum]|uniref:SUPERCENTIPEDE1 n=1 Tax=Hibiscus trionum TaxID=183268 RepID=A0A9W7H0Z6_HIBTR|nr:SUPERCENTIPEDE1 [Hibiscus trionum]
MGLVDDKNKEKDARQESDGDGGAARDASSFNTADQDDDNDAENKLHLGPQCSLKEQLEKDKDDESLRKWKEQLLGSVDINNIGETLDPEVKFISVAIVAPERPDIVLSIPEDGKPHGLWFTLKEGCHYRLKFSFQVSNNIVSGLKYTNTVWKSGLRGKPLNPYNANWSKTCLKRVCCSVFSTKDMIGTFSPQQEPYTHEMPEETAPSGFMAKGSYTAKSKFIDDDNKCHLEINYTFDIRKDWSSKE